MNNKWMEIFIKATKLLSMVLLKMYPKDFFSWMRPVYKIGGAHDPNDEKGFWKIFFQVYNTAVLIAALLYTPIEMLKLGETSRNVHVLIEHFGMIIMHWVADLKIVLLWLQRNKIKNVVKRLDSEEFKYEDYKAFQPGRIISRNNNVAKFFLTMFLLFAHSVAFSTQSVAVIDLIKKRSLINGVNTTCNEILPYYTWFPFNIDNFANCSTAFVLQSLIIILYIYPITVHDMTFIYLSIYIRGHLMVLKEAFATMRQRCLVRLGLPENYEVLRDDENPKLEREIKIEYQKLTFHLQSVINASADVESIFQYTLLGQSLSTLFILVSCLYILSIVPLFSSIAFGQFEFLSALLYQYSIFCFFGNEVTIMSERVIDGIYFADWLSCTRAVKKSMLLNMERLRKPIYFTMGKFAPLSLATFIQILKGSYSFFTFLTQSTNRK